MAKNFSATDVALLQDFWVRLWGQYLRADRALHLLKLKESRTKRRQFELCLLETIEQEDFQIRHFNWNYDVLIFETSQDGELPPCKFNKIFFMNVEIYTVIKEGVSFDSFVQPIWNRGGLEIPLKVEDLEDWFGIDAV